MDLLSVTSAVNGQKYILEKPIGCWGSDYPQTSVYVATTEHEGQTNYEVVKLAHRINEGEMHDMGTEEIERNKSFAGYTRILNISDHFNVVEDNNTLCLVLPFDGKVSSVRSLMQSSQKYQAIGLTEDCIAIVLRQALIGLCQIHSVPGELHRQISAANIFFDHRDNAIKLAFAGSVYKRTERRGLDWAPKAPEVLEDPDAKFRMRNYSAKSDIWLIGITALEMGFGEIKVSSGKELLAIADYISKNRTLPNTWEELKTEALKFSKNGDKKQIITTKLIKKNGSDQETNSRAPFSKSFVNMVAICLAGNQDHRPTAGKLLQHKFFKNCKSLEYFKDMLLSEIP